MAGKVVYLSTMKAFGFLSFGHHSIGNQPGPDARQVLHDQLEISQAADELGVNGAYFRVHHFAPQGASPMPLLSAVAATTKHIEVGTGVIDMRYENPLFLAEEAAALDLLADARVALGVSRGSPEPAVRGWESFGYKGEAENGADMAAQKLDTFIRAINGEGFAVAAPYGQQYPTLYNPGTPLPIFPHSPGLMRRVWYGSGTRESARKTAQMGLNLMSSTLVSEADGRPFGELQADQIRAYREAWKEAGHDWTPRVSVSRSIFPLVTDRDRALFNFQGESSKDQIGMLEGATRTTFGRTYADEPDRLVELLKQDPAIEMADTLLLTVPNQLGVETNVSILENFAKYVAPELGWIPNDQGPVTGYEF